VALQIVINQVRWQHLAAAASSTLWFAVVRVWFAIRGSVVLVVRQALEAASYVQCELYDCMVLDCL
jgi:hypothetical protein